MQACPVCGGPGGVLLLYTVSPCDRCNARMDIGTAAGPLVDNAIETPFGQGILIKRGKAAPSDFVLSFARWVYDPDSDQQWWVISGTKLTDRLVSQARSSGVNVYTAPSFDFLFSKDPQSPDRIWF